MSIIQSIRERGALISAIVIALALLGFILTDYLSTRGGSLFDGNRSTTIGVINGNKIDVVEFERRIKQQEDMMKAQGQNLGEMGRQQIIESIWSEEVNRAIMDEEFENLGIAVGSRELNDMLYGSNPPPDLKQRFTNEQGVYDANAARQFMNQLRNSNDQTARQQLEDYLASLEYSRMMQKYTSMLINSIYFPKWFIEKQMTESSALAKVSYVRELYNTVPDSTVVVSDKEIENYIDDRKSAFKQEESRSISYVMFDAAPTSEDSAKHMSQLQNRKEEFENTSDPAAFVARYGSNIAYYDGYTLGSKMQGPFADSIKPLSDSAVFGPYLDEGNYVLAKKIGRINMPDSVKVRHILIKIADNQAGQIRDDSTARLLADSIMNAVATGADFNQLVLKYSDDPGSKTTGGEYEFGSTSGLVKNFYETSFYKPVGTKEVVRGESQEYIGYHYIEVLRQWNFEPAYKVAYLSKPIFASDETENTAANKANVFAQESEDLKSFDQNFEKNLKPQGIQKMFATNIKPNDYFITGLNVSRPLVKKIYEADEGEVLQPEMVGDKYVVAVVTDIYEEGTQTAATARAAVEPIIRNQKKADIIKKKIGNITSLEDAAARLGQQITAVDSLRFLGSSPNLGYEPKIIGASFNPSNKGKVVDQALAGQAGVYVLRVDDISATSIANPSIEDQRKALEAEAKQRASGYNPYSQQQNPPFLEVLKEDAEIKDYRRRFY